MRKILAVLAAVGLPVLALAQPMPPAGGSAINSSGSSTKALTAPAYTANGGGFTANQLSAPVNATFTQSTGTLGAATYYYRVTALYGTTQTTPSTETSLAITASHGVLVKWSAVANATGYKVYGRSTGAELLMATITGGTTTQWLDDGSVTPSGALPTTNTTGTTTLNGPATLASLAVSGLISGTTQTNTGVTTLQNRLDLASTNGTAHHRLQYVASSSSSTLTLTDTSGTAMMSWDTSGGVEMGGGNPRLFFGAGTLTNGGPYVGPSSTAVLLAGGAAASGTNVISNAQVAVTTGKIHSFQNAGTEKIAVGGAGQFIVPTGTADATAGRAALTTGTVTISTTAVTASSIFSLVRCVGAGTAGLPQVGTVVAGTSFVINSIQPGTASTVQSADTSTICWRILAN